ncbi:hypothetical protein CJ030_MR2G000490 [Morella rubra]|uniref:Uncharacterized protein n=1 Tax=Morella rubra TaxID=262757 RepID=A0A6A1WM05_9ROSI|nr:hypothetical protein CJ030_MR2G000490 [Morella rubra]
MWSRDISSSSHHGSRNGGWFESVPVSTDRSGRRVDDDLDDEEEEEEEEDEDDDEDEEEWRMTFCLATTIQTMSDKVYFRWRVRGVAPGGLRRPHHMFVLRVHPTTARWLRASLQLHPLAGGSAVRHAGWIWTGVRQWEQASWLLRSLMERLLTLVTMPGRVLVRRLVDMATWSWGDVSTETKQYIKAHLQDDFGLNYDRLEDVRTVNRLMVTRYRKFKNTLHMHYKKFPTKEEALKNPHEQVEPEMWTKLCNIFADPRYEGKSEINRRNRSKLTVYHTTGTKSFARKRHELLGAVHIDEVGPADLYAASHKRKNGEWICDAARMNFEKMMEVTAQAIMEGRMLTNVEKKIQQHNGIKSI